MEVSVEVYRYGEDHEEAAREKCFGYTSDDVSWHINADRHIDLTRYGRNNTVSCDYDPATGVAKKAVWIERLFQP